MADGRFRRRVAALAIGAAVLVTVAAFTSDFAERWHGLLALVSVTVVVTMGIAVVERWRGKLSPPALAVALSLPGVVLVMVGTNLPAIVGPGGLSVFYAAVSTPYWFLLPFALPLTYSIGRVETKRWQRRIAVVLVLAASLFLVHFVIPAPEPNTRPLGMAIRIVAVCTWAAIPLYGLGVELRKWTEGDAAPWLVPTVVAAYVSAWLLVGVLLTVGSLQADPAGSAIDLVLLGGPVVYFASRARRRYRSAPGGVSHSE